MSKKIIFDFSQGQPPAAAPAPQPAPPQWYPGEPAYLFSQREGYHDQEEGPAEEGETVEETLTELVAFEKYQNNGH